MMNKMELKLNQELVNWLPVDEPVIGDMGGEPEFPLPDVGEIVNVAMEDGETILAYRDAGGSWFEMFSVCPLEGVVAWAPKLRGPVEDWRPEADEEEVDA